MKPFHTRKNIRAGHFTAGTLAEVQAAPADYPQKRKLRKNLCSPDSHRWQDRKHFRRCVLCGKEELRP